MGLPHGPSELDQVLLSLEADAEGFLEALDLLDRRLLLLLSLLLDLLGGVLLSSAPLATGRDGADGGEVVSISFRFSFDRRVPFRLSV